MDLDVEMADDGVQIPIEGGESDDDHGQGIEIESGVREIDIESNDGEIKIGPSDREIEIKTSDHDQMKVENPAEISGARQLLGIETRYEKMPTGQLLIELFLAILGKFAYEQKDVENPESMEMLMLKIRIFM